MKALLFLFLPLCLMANPEPSPFTKNFSKGAVTPQSISTLSFGPDGILFIGDSMGATIYALDLEDRTSRNSEEAVNISDLETKIGSLLGTDASDVLIHDMAVNPISQNVYFAVSRGLQKWNHVWKLPNDVANADVLLKVTPDGKMGEVSLKQIAHSKVTVKNPVDPELEISWKKTKLRVDTFTDMAYSNGRLYVAGLSNEEFASTMRVVPFPFSEDVTSTQLEIFHGAHGKYETHSPIRTFIPQKINGKEHLLAAYLCTPLVVFPADHLEDNQKIKGRTLAELGSGNFPLDMVSYQKKGKPYILLINSARPTMRFDPEVLETSKDHIKTQAGPGVGMKFDHIRGQGILQADRLNDEFVLMLTRRPNGNLDLSSTATVRL